MGGLIFKGFIGTHEQEVFSRGTLRRIMEVAKYEMFFGVFLYVDYVVLRECLKSSKNNEIFELVLISTTPHLLQSWQHLPHSWQTIHGSIKIRCVFRCFCLCWWGRVVWLFKITVKHKYSRRVPSEGMRNYVIYHTVGTKKRNFLANCVVYAVLSHSFGQNSPGILVFNGDFEQ